MDNRKIWTQNQENLRKALSSKARFDEAVELFVQQHAAVHSAAISNPAGWSLHDEVLTGLSEAHIQTVPRPGQNSIAWLLWHISRIEDMTINTLTLQQEQVWNPKWAERLAIASPDCGASMDENDVSDFSKRISVPALMEYRAAVGTQTRQTIHSLSALQAKEIAPASDVQKLVEEGSINFRAGWLYDFYLNRPRGFFLTRTATSHNYVHLNEAGRISARLLA